MNEDKHKLMYVVRVRELEQEVEHLKGVLWATVRAAGGRVSVPYEIWSDRVHDNVLVFQDNPNAMSIVIEAQKGDSNDEAREDESGSGEGIEADHWWDQPRKDQSEEDGLAGG